MASQETEIDEFYSCKFAPNGEVVFVGGKRKSRDIWNDDEDDNLCLPGEIKVFDVLSSKVVLRLEGHMEEILQIKLVSFQEKQYAVSCGQDGLVIRWQLSNDFRYGVQAARVCVQV